MVLESLEENKEHAMGTFPKMSFGWLFVLGSFSILTILVSGCLQKTTPQDIEKNFEQHKEDMWSLSEFCRSRIPDEVRFMVKLQSNDRINLVIWNLKNKYENIITKRNVRTSHPKVQESLKAIGWTLEDLDSLHILLNRTNCQSIRMGFRGTKFKNVIELGYKTSGFNTIVYLLFPEQLSKTQMEEMKYLTGDPVKWLSNRVGWSYIGAAWD